MNEEKIPKAHNKLKSLTGPTPPVIPDKKAITVVNIASDNAWPVCTWDSIKDSSMLLPAAIPSW